MSRPAPVREETPPDAPGRRRPGRPLRGRLDRINAFLKIGQESEFIRRQRELGKAHEIGFADLFGLLWERRNLLSAAVAVTLLASMTYGILTPAVYQAEVVMAPVSTDLDDSALPSLGGLSSLASLAGLGGNRTNSIQQNLAVLNSRALAERFIEKSALAPHLFPGRWDAEAKRWKPPGGPIAAILGAVAGRSNAVAEPTPDEIYRKFKDVRILRQDDLSGLVTLRINWRDPRLASQIANRYVDEANEFIRARHIAEAEQSLRFLSNELATTSLTEIQRSIYQLVATETKRSMIANVRKEFAFKIIDPAVVPEIRIWPSFRILFALGIIGGLLLGVAVIVLDTWLCGVRHARK